MKAYKRKRAASVGAALFQFGVMLYKPSAMALAIVTYKL